jgi:hypothetical protein
MHITNSGEDSEKSVKTAYAKRRVPIHSRLEQIGLLNFVAKQRQSGSVRLFPDLKRDNKGQFGAVSKFYGKYLIVSVRCPPPNRAVSGTLVSTIDSGHLGALYGGEAEETALAG